MKQCSKCKVEKELNQFQTYWHSTQQKHRTRNECTECLYKQRNEKKRLRRKEAKLIKLSIPTEILQPEVPELQPEVLEHNPNHKQCRTCKEWKDKSEFYLYKSKSKKPYLDCRTCCNKVEAERAKKKRERIRTQQGGALRKYTKPNQWYDEEQRQSTFDILKSIGWTFNEENGIWWKDGIKTSDGVFTNIKSKYELKFSDYPINVRTAKKKELFERAVELRKVGMSYENIGLEIGVSQTTVYLWLKNK